ncbi:MAG: VWA domain-containing protein [Planctomycetota bacterium]
MNFLRPDWLWFVALAALLFPVAALVRRGLRRVDLDRFAGSRAVFAWGASPGRLRFLSAALLLALAALAGPEWGTELVEAPIAGVDLIAVVDVSLSMRARDSQPDRLGLAKRELTDLSREFQGGRLGLVTFGGAGDLVCPLTHDRAGFASFVQEIDPLLTSKGGTSIGAGLERALAAFDPESRAQRAILLISDGENLQDDERIEAGSWTAYSQGVVIHSVRVGSKYGGKVPRDPLAGGGFLQDEAGRDVISVPDSRLLQTISNRTGGLFLDADLEPFPVSVILKERLNGARTGVSGMALREAPVDRYRWCLALGLLLLLLPCGRREARPIPASVPLALLLLLLLLPFTFGGSTASDLAREAVRQFDQGEFEEAFRQFEQAFLADPESAEIGFDLAVTAYRLGRYDQASRGFDRVERQAQPLLSAKAAFGGGVARAREAAAIVAQAGDDLGRLGPAVTLLRQARGQLVRALRLGYGRPAAVDLELVTLSLFDLERRMRGQRDPGGGQGKQDQEEGPQEPAEKDDSQAEGNPDQNAGEEQPTDPAGGDRTDGQKADREGSVDSLADLPTRLPGGMFREEARNLERIVQRYERDRREYDHRRAQKTRAGVERDW